MKLSELQKYILKQAWQAKDKTVTKDILNKFYNGCKKKPKPKDLITIITKSVERLIKKELVIGYGWRTPHKWFIRHVKLTPKGRKTTRSLFGIQQKLPLKNAKIKIKKSK